MMKKKNVLIEQHFDVVRLRRGKGQTVQIELLTNSVGTAPDSWSEGGGFKPRQGRRENALLQS